MTCQTEQRLGERPSAGEVLPRRARSSDPHQRSDQHLSALLTASTDVFFSAVSNRQNAVMKQLTVILTVFLPPSVLSGVFGQNFDWMIGHLGGWPAFGALGIGVGLVD